MPQSIGESLGDRANAKISSWFYERLPSECGLRIGVGLRPRGLVPPPHVHCWGPLRSGTTLVSPSCPPRSSRYRRKADGKPWECCLCCFLFCCWLLFPFSGSCWGHSGSIFIGMPQNHQAILSFFVWCFRSVALSCSAGDCFNTKTRHPDNWMMACGSL